jgi:phosphoglycolate phosphatase
MKLPPPALVIFDWDDTLVDNYAAIHTAINAARAAFALPIWSLTETRENCRLALTEIFPQWFGAAWPQARDIFYDSFAAHHLAMLTIKPEAVTLLDILTARAIPLAVNSNKRKDYLRQEIAHLGWGHYFSCVVGAGDVQRGKPDPVGVQHIRTHCGIGDDQTLWFVGDNAVDEATAIAGDCLPIIITQHNPNNSVNDTYIMPDISSLITAI